MIVCRASEPKEVEGWRRVLDLDQCTLPSEDEFTIEEPDWRRRSGNGPAAGSREWSSDGQAQEIEPKEPQAAALIWLVRKYPDTLERLESLGIPA